VRNLFSLLTLAVFLLGESACTEDEVKPQEVLLTERDFLAPVTPVPSRSPEMVAKAKELLRRFDPKNNPPAYGRYLRGRWQESMQDVSPVALALCEAKERWEAAEEFKEMVDSQPSMVTEVGLTLPLWYRYYWQAGEYYAAQLFEAARQHTIEQGCFAAYYPPEPEYVKKAREVMAEAGIFPEDLNFTELEVQKMAKGRSRHHR
jgi:hypothetical protein